MRIFLFKAMFTGIVEELGIVKGLKSTKNLATLSVAAKKVTKDLKAGDSVAVNGVCLTVTHIKGGVIAFEIMKESLTRTTLGILKPNEKVNLERALKANSRLSGHFVTGHIDDVGVIRQKLTQRNYLAYEIKIDTSLRRYLVPKGSITIDGVSLTVGQVKKNSFIVHLIPFTLKVTTLGQKKIGDRVNIETDIVAKYIFQNKKPSANILRKYLTIR